MGNKNVRKVSMKYFLKFCVSPGQRYQKQQILPGSFLGKNAVIQVIFLYYGFIVRRLKVLNMLMNVCDYPAPQGRGVIIVK